MSYHALDARVASFPKRASKSRPAWPHRGISVSSLASAGFYYSGTQESPDSVTCFLCNKSLDGWDGDEVPLEEHESHMDKESGCPWVALLRSVDEKGRKKRNEEMLPRSRIMIMCRERTFEGAWEHDMVKGSEMICARQMAAAGFYFNPLEKGDDTASCLFCEAALGGWEPSDDPLEEHRRRFPNCYFFTS
ncbi:BIR-domain-containing protein, partial [Atractiella rhizophila]